MGDDSVVLSNGTSLYRGQVGLTGSIIWEKVRRVSSFSGPNPSKTKIDNTPFGEEYQTYTYGLINGGDISFTLFFDRDDPVHKKLISQDIFCIENTPWKMVLSDGSSFEFLGNLTTHSFSGEIDTAVGWSFSLTVSGKPTWNLI